ncbi:MAG: zf-HC2 domain-containing protein [Candidatus Omnitrophica bacterium]|nr:zf-HC2 domain-containing protein [Candidatus Omnitrophota bacterium]
MLKCFFIKRKLYDYLDNSLSETQRIGVKEHLARCRSCKEELNRMHGVIGLTRSKPSPVPSEDFWSKFNIELDEKLNNILVAPAAFKPKRKFLLKPALVMPVVSMIIIAIGMYFLLNNKTVSRSGHSESELINEILLLEEVSPEAVLIDGDSAYLQ